MLTAVESFLKHLPVYQRNLAYQTREVLLSLDDSISESFKHKTPFYTYKTKNIFYFNFSKSKVLVLGVIYGAFLNDFSGLLEGDQKLVRHINLENAVSDSDEMLTVLHKAILYVENKFFAS